MDQLGCMAIARTDNEDKVESDFLFHPGDRSSMIVYSYSHIYSRDHFVFSQDTKVESQVPMLNLLFPPLALDDATKSFEPVTLVSATSFQGSARSVKRE